MDNNGNLENSVNEPFLPNSDDTIDNSNHGEHIVEYEGELIYMDSINWRDSKLLKFQIISVYLCFVYFGMAEQAVGSLIPVFQESYHVNDTQTGFIFLASVTGYISMGLLNGTLHNLMGFKGVMIFGTCSLLLGALVLSTAPPFFMVVLSSSLNGTGFGILDAACNAWLGSLSDSNQILGLVHGCYGLGCMISPSLISYLLLKSNNPWKWNHYYIVLASIASICLLVSGIFFRNETAKKHKYCNSVKIASMKKTNSPSIEMNSLNSSNDIEELEDESTNESLEAASLLESMKSGLIWIFALALFIYVGSEASFGGWVITFLTRIKKFEYKYASHMATAYWTGVMVGRVGLGFITALYFSNELRANMAYIVGSVIGYGTFFILTEFTSWSFILFFVVFFTGLAVGPIFPTTIVAAIGVLHPRYHSAGVGFICAFGGGGIAFVPFLIGLIADSVKNGLWYFPVVEITCALIVFFIWFYVCKRFMATYGKNTI